MLQSIAPFGDCKPLYLSLQRNVIDIMSMRIAHIWRHITTTRYARTLECELARERATAAEQGIELARKGEEIVRQSAEIARLRAENRALLNSILGIAGIPPLPATEADLAAIQASPAPVGVCAAGVPPEQLPFSGTGTLACAPWDDARHDAAHSAPVRDDGVVCTAGVAPAPLPSVGQAKASRTRSASHLAAPMRRRSWPQIHRLLEFQSAKKDTPASEPLPPARQ
jgi:hypothetical protein